ncbi:hypothetical protein BH10PSE10_BH10PSE10_21890 [soil metagenome]
MADKKKPYDDKLHIDLPFEDAVERFIGVDPAEMHANIERSKKKKPPGGKKKVPSDGNVDQNVVSLRDRRIRKRNHGR